MSYSRDIWTHRGELSCVSGFPDVVGVGEGAVSLSGAASLMRRVGGKRLARSNGRGLVASPSIPVTPSESHNYIYSANIGPLSIRWYCKGLDWENF